MWEGHRPVIYDQQCHWLAAWLAQWLTGPAPCVFQVIVQSGRQPSVLQKLCQLPFQYFSHPRLIKVLFPSLISACYNNPQNKVILQQDMSCVLLATFIQVNTGPWTHAVHEPTYTVYYNTCTCYKYTNLWFKYQDQIKCCSPNSRYIFKRGVNFFQC